RAGRTFGDAGALAVAQAASAIVPAVRDFVGRRGLDVWLREAPMLEVSAAPVQDEAVAAAVAAAHELGVEEEAVPLGREELARRCASPRFRRGVQIGRASCRERVQISVVEVSSEKER